LLKVSAGGAPMMRVGVALVPENGGCVNELAGGQDHPVDEPPLPGAPPAAPPLAEPPAPPLLVDPPELVVPPELVEPPELDAPPLLVLPPDPLPPEPLPPELAPPLPPPAPPPELQPPSAVALPKLATARSTSNFDFIVGGSWRASVSRRTSRDHDNDRLPTVVRRAAAGSGNASDARNRVEAPVKSENLPDPMVLHQRDVQRIAGGHLPVRQHEIARS